MGGIPKQEKKKVKRIVPDNIKQDTEKKKVLFSFESLERNEYFNLDGTCVRWSSDLFDAMQEASKITMKDIHAGKYSGKTSPFRIHRHEDAKPPCSISDNIQLDDLWQIRISLSKGGIHGLFVDNIFYVIWLDPQHNLYPDKNHGGLVKIDPPSTCCKERDKEISILKEQLDEAREEIAFLNEYIQESEKNNVKE